MEFRIDGNPDHGDLTVALGPGERVLAQGGSMAAMASHLELRTRVPGGVLRGIARKLVGGTSFFLAEYGHEQGGWVSLSPATPGEVVQRRLEGDALLLTSGTFLACHPDVSIRPKWGGFRALLSGEGAFLLEASGRGELFFQTYGALVERQIDGELIVDTGHLVAFEPSLDWKLGGMGNWKSTLFSGEGLVMRFSGRGKVWLQTRTLPELAGWLAPLCGTN